MLALELPTSVNFATIFDLFDFLQKQNKKILLILDEYQYFKESKKNMELDSIMQSIIDSVSENIKIIFCGSYISIMKELLEEENIKELLLNENSLFRTYIENVMIKEIQKSYDIRILQNLANGKKRYREISNFLGINDTGLLDKQLKNLLSMETIAKVFSNK